MEIKVSEMNPTTGTSGGDSDTAWVVAARSDPTMTRGLFDVEVGTADEIRLTPKTELAKSLLAMWLAMDWRPSIICKGGPGDESSYGRGVIRLEIKLRSAPLLADGNDPHYTGRKISPDEAAACRKLLEKMRRASRKRR